MLFSSVLCLLELCNAAYALPASRNPQVGASDDWPTVDLKYSRYRPTAINEEEGYYNFSNIRYAAPPVGDRRWKAPQPPLSTGHRHVENGSLGFICPQSAPSWFYEGNTALGRLGDVIPPAVSSQEQSEDCLFLDVTAPVKSFPTGPGGEDLQKKLAPVLVNIHGGGFWMGEKRALYPPNGLLKAGNNSFVYVSVNYRVTCSPKSL